MSAEPEVIERARSIVLKALEAAPEELGIAKAWLGPRHNEVGFSLKDGGHVALSVWPND